jgi:predicted transposase/invertase (TIGR01784 family)
MEQTIRAYHQITADPEFREMERMREMARHDEASALRHARDEGEVKGRVEITRNLKLLGVSTDLIIKSTGLSQEEIANL